MVLLIMDPAGIAIQSSFHSDAVIVSDVHPLSEALVNNLTTQGIFVYIVSDQADLWKHRVYTLAKSVRIFDTHTFPTLTSLDYLVYADLGQVVSQSSSQMVELTKRLLTEYRPKAVGLFPYQVTLERKRTIDSTRENLRIEGKTPLTFYLDMLVRETDNGIEFVGETYPISFPATIQEVTKVIERSLFSFGNYNERIALLGEKYIHPQQGTTSEIVRMTVDKEDIQTHTPILESNIRSAFETSDQTDTVQTQKPQTNVVQTKEASSVSDSPKSGILIPPIKMVGVRNQTQLLEVHPLENTPFRTQVTQSKPKKHFKHVNRSMVKITRFSVVIICLFFILIPVLLQGIGLGMVLTSKHLVSLSRYAPASQIFDGAYTINSSTGKYLRIVSKGPLQSVYASQIRLADTMRRISGIGKSYSDIQQQTDFLIVNIFDKNASEMASLTQVLSLELDSLDRELGFFETSLQADGWESRVIQNLIQNVDIHRMRTNASSSKKLVSLLPELLGSTTQTRFALVVQDSTLHRPSGGVVTSVIVPTFSGGKIVDIDVFDPDYIDTQIKGKVEAPSLISSTFNLNTWPVREVNVESDYSQNAQQLLWFLEKSLDLTAHSVITVDATVLTRISNVLTIPVPHNSDSDSMRTFIEDFTSEIPDNRESRDELYSEISHLLNNKNIQAFSENDTLGAILESHGISDEVSVGSCIGNCYTDIAGIVELTRSDSKDTKSIERSAHLTITFEQGLLKRNFLVTYENKGSQRYSSLVGVLAQGNAGFDLVREVKNTATTLVEPQIYAYDGYKQVLVEMALLPGESVTYSYNWESGTDIDSRTPGEYKLFVKKQSGLELHDLGLFYSFPNSISLSSDLVLSLTNEGVYRYNTQLESDLINSLSW